MRKRVLDHNLTKKIKIDQISPQQACWFHIALILVHHKLDRTYCAPSNLLIVLLKFVSRYDNLWLILD